MQNGFCRCWFLFFTLSGTLGEGLGAPVDSIEISIVPGARDDGSYEFHVRNISGQPLSALSIEYVTVYEDGTSSSVVQTWCFFESLHRALEGGEFHDAGPIYPGQKLRVQAFPQAGDSLRVLDFKAVPVVAVFVDRSSEGDPFLISRIFRRREEVQLATSRLLGDLRRLRGRRSGDPRLRAEVEALRGRYVTGGERISNGRVSTLDPGARAAAQSMAGQLEELLEAPSEAEFVALLDHLTSELEIRFETGQAHVQYDIDGGRID